MRECPPIPPTLTGSCYVERPLPATNGQLADQWIELRACAQEQDIKLRAVEALASCRLKGEPE